ncbi:GIY-YIG nuclease family protein [bacterium]|jgi:putative endonuclease|nr:GIY-YIG nuclease family protein [bacterium]MBT3730272.1 GIY-YIG nuclease family protein [bacterium]
MYYVYIIKNKEKIRDLYIGYTSDLRRRLKEHGVSKEDLVYYEAYKDKDDAVRRETKLKDYKSSWGQLKKRIVKSRI